MLPLQEEGRKFKCRKIPDIHTHKREWQKTDLDIVWVFDNFFNTYN